MATKGKNSIGPNVTPHYISPEKINYSFESQQTHPDNYAILSTAQINLMEQFVEFCKSKKSKHIHQHSKHPKRELCKHHVDIFEFKTKLVGPYGDYLPSEVIDGLCNLVQEQCHNRCKFCSLSSENLVPSVLQILSDAASKKSEKVLRSNNTSGNKSKQASVKDDNPDMSKNKAEEGRGIPSPFDQMSSEMNVVNEDKSESALESTCTPTVLATPSNEECSHQNVEVMKIKPSSIPRKKLYNKIEKLHGKESNDTSMERTMPVLYLLLILQRFWLKNLPTLKVQHHSQNLFTT